MTDFIFFKRVEFSETDMAGIVHFSNFFRYMEIAEHAFFRSLGFSVHPREQSSQTGWPRVHVSCDYHAPAFFEDELEIHLKIMRIGEKSLTYQFDISRIAREEKTLCATGKIVAAHIAFDEKTQQMRSVPIPSDFVQKIDVYNA